MADPLVPDPLERAIAAHRRVNPEAYRAVGLRAVEEDAMVAALAAAQVGPNPLTPEEADAVAGILGGTVALVESLRPEAQEKYKRGAWWTAYEKLRALASTGRGTE